VTKATHTLCGTSHANFGVMRRMQCDAPGKATRLAVIRAFTGGG